MIAATSGPPMRLPYEHFSDYLFNMSVLSRKEARRVWRSSIKEAWSNCCAYCGQPPIDDGSLTIDHVKPRCKGGEDRTSNVIPACSNCNLGKGSENWLEWYQRQCFHDIEREQKIKKWLASDLSNFEEWKTENDLMQ